MIMSHMGVSFLYCSLLLSSCLFFLFHFSMQSLKIGSLNINGGRDKNKRALISEVSNLKRVDVLLLQETHTIASDEADWSLWWGGSCFLSHGTNVSAGVAVLFKSTVNVTILSNIEIVKGRLQIVRARINNSTFCFVNIYAPNQGTERLAFFSLLKTELIKYHQDQLVIGGDFNCTTDFIMDRTGEEPHPQSSQSLNSIITQLDLLDTWRVKNPQARQYTWVRVNKNSVCAARLDRIYISQNLTSRLSHSNISPVGFSDHHLVCSDLVILPGERVKSHWFFNNKLLQDNSFNQSFVLFWQLWKTKKIRF